MSNKTDWLWIDWFIFCIRLCWFLTGAVYYFVEESLIEEISYPIFLGMMALCFLVPQIFWRPDYTNRVIYHVTEFVLITSFSTYIHIYSEIDLGTSIILMSMLMVGYLATKKTAVWTIPIALIILPIIRYSSSKTLFSFLIQYVDIAIFFGIGISFNLMVLSQRRMKTLLEENKKQYELIHTQHKVLEQYTEQIEKVTLLRERNRLARELHDTIGHHFTSVTVGLDAVSFLIDVDTEKAKEKIQVLSRVSRDGLDEIRKNIHQIAPSEDDGTLSEQLHQIVKDFSSHTSTKVNFTLAGEEFPVTRQIRLTFIRCLQESLTNAKRHGNASEIVVSMRFSSHTLILEIENNGTTTSIVNPGFGLTAMRERLEEIHGKLEINTETDKGMRLTCTVPVREVGVGG